MCLQIHLCIHLSNIYLPVTLPCLCSGDVCVVGAEVKRGEWMGRNLYTLFAQPSSLSLSSLLTPENSREMLPSVSSSLLWASGYWWSLKTNQALSVVWIFQGHFQRRRYPLSWVIGDLMSFAQSSLCCFKVEDRPGERPFCQGWKYDP